MLQELRQQIMGARIIKDGNRQVILSTTYVFTVCQTLKLFTYENSFNPHNNAKSYYHLSVEQKRKLKQIKQVICPRPNSWLGVGLAYKPRQSTYKINFPNHQSPERRCTRRTFCNGEGSSRGNQLDAARVAKETEDALQINQEITQRMQENIC